MLMEISKDTLEFLNEQELELKDIFKQIDKNTEEISAKVLEAFHEQNATSSFFTSTTGYGYDDKGRDRIEQIFARVLDGEDAIVRGQFISGTHALTVALFAYLRPNDKMLSITGLPYDTLHEVIGIKENPSSLMSFNVKYEEIDLINDDFDYEKEREELLKRL